MSALLQGVPRRNAAGRLLVTNGDLAPHHYANGLPYEANGDLAVKFGGTLDHFHQGLPFTAAGRFLITGAPPSYVGNGAAPFTVVGADTRLSVHTTTAISHFSSGVGYTAAQEVATDPA